MQLSRFFHNANSKSPATLMAGGALEGTMEHILIILIAIKQAIKQYHWNARSYQDHLLGERLLEGLEDYIDEVAEISKVNQGDPDLSAQTLLAEAAKFIGDRNCNSVKAIANLLFELIQELNAQEENAAIIGIKDIFSRLSNSALRKLYLIDTQFVK